MILSNKTRIKEGFMNNAKDKDKDKDNDKDNAKDKDKDKDNDKDKDTDTDKDKDKDNCEYRKKKRGRMCGVKWGEPPCNSWVKTKNVEDLTKRKKSVLKGYYQNDFMYEIDYEEYLSEPIEKDITDTGELQGGIANIPRGVHSSFFS